MNKGIFITICKYGVVLALSLVISRGDYFGLIFALSFLYAFSLARNSLISSFLVFIVTMTAIDSLTFLGALLITLSISVTTLLIKLIKGRLRQYIEPVGAVAISLSISLVIGFELVDFLVGIVLCAVFYYLIEKTLNKDDVISNVEYVGVIAFSFVFGLGLVAIPIFYGNLYNLLIAFLMCISFSLLKKEQAMGVVVSLCLAGYVASSDVGYLLSPLLLSITLLLFFSFAKRFLPLVLIAIECVMTFVVKCYKEINVTSFILFSIGALVYLLVPNSILAVNNNERDEIPERIVNEGRSVTGKRLKELAETFKNLSVEIQEKKRDISSENMLSIIVCECKKRCAKCNYYLSCKILKELDSEFENLGITAMSKGSVNLLDCSENLYKNCKNIDGILSTATNVANKSTKISLKKACVEDFNEMLIKVFDGVADVLTEESYELNREVAFDRELEYSVYDQLKLNNIRTKEIFCIRNSLGYPTVKLTLYEKGNRGKAIARAVSKAAGIDMVAKKDKIKGNVVTFIPKVRCDVTFGVSSRTKDKSESSGDAFVLTRISDYSFMVALSDGMGSGENAKKISEKTLSIIENLFLVGFSEDVVCPLVNTLVNFSFLDSFVATDICIIDLITLNSTFIKLGTTPTYLVKEEVMKVSGNALPVGILEDVTPTKKSVTMQIGNMIVITSDGVYDALKEKTAVVLNKGKNLNPQDLSDFILKEALFETNDVAYDDMTVIVLKVI